MAAVLDKDATPHDLRLGELKELPYFLLEEQDERSTPKPESDLSGRLSTLDLNGVTETVAQIVELRLGDNEDEYGRLRPTDYAFRETIEVVLRTLDLGVEYAKRRRMRSPFPRGAVATDDRGGLRIEWFNDDTAVRLVVPSNQDGGAYIYHQIGDDYGITKVTGEALFSWLQKLLVK